MRPALRLFSLFAALLLGAAPALAVPPPKSEAELMKESDLVALVRVLSVTCTSITKHEKTGEDLPGYLARLEVLAAKKGDVKPGEELLVTWRAKPKKLIGPWSVPYYPGEKVWTHLTLRSGGVTYATTWLNAKGKPMTAPETKELPKVVGKSVMAKSP